MLIKFMINIAFLRLTSSNVLILNSNLVELNKPKIKINNYNLKYPTKNKILIKILVTVRLGNYFIKIPMFAEINDDCILEVDFSKKLNFQNIFESVFHNYESDVKNNIKCFCIKESHNVLLNLKTLFEKNSRNLDESQKKKSQRNLFLFIF